MGVKPDSSYKISGISSEHEVVTHPDLAKCVSDKYKNMVS